MSEFSAIDDSMLRIRALVVDELELDLAPDQLDETADLVEVYGADSMALIQVMARMDRELGISLPPDEYPASLRVIRSFLAGDRA